MKLALVVAIAALATASLEVSAANRSKGYHSLRDVEMYPAYQPRFEHGIDHLRKREMRFKERLPLQLSAPIQKVSARKYR